MVRYLLIRVATMIFVLWLVSVGLFFLSHAAPGGPIASLVPPDQVGLSGPLIQEKIHEFGLDKSLPIQYLTWAGKVVRGDLGTSFQYNVPVLGLILQRTVATIELMGLGLALGTVAAVVLGRYTAARKGGPADYALGGASLTFLAIPAFFLGMLGIFIFSAKLRWLPSSGMTAPDDGGLWDHIRHLILPVAVLAVLQGATLMRYVRAGLLEELDRDYVRTTIAKGSTIRQARAKAFRNSLIPLVTILMMSVPSLLSGAVVLEAVFAWPGMGSLTLGAIQFRDYPVVLGFGLMVALVVVLSNLIADLLLRSVDPRVRLA